MPTEIAHDVITALDKSAEDEEVALHPEVQRIARILSTYFDEHMLADVQDAVLTYLFNILLAQSKQLYRNSLTSGKDPLVLIQEALPVRLSKDKRKRLAKPLLSLARISEKERASKSRSRVVREEICYLCGNDLNEGFGHIHDHIVPKRAGGSQNPQNIRTAHPYCEAVKRDMFRAADFAIFHFAYTQLPSGIEGGATTWWPIELTEQKSFVQFVDRISHAQMRLALLQRQSYKCKNCKLDFSPKQQPQAVRRESDRPWSFSNTEFVCTPCLPVSNP